MECGLSAGFARLEITPEGMGFPLGGYGATQHRLHEEVIDPLWMNVLALGRGKYPECLFFVLDLVNIPDLTETFRKGVSEETGVPEEHLFFSATHTHSAPDLTSPMPCIQAYKREVLEKKVREAARLAVEDLSPASVSFGRTEVGHPGIRLNFVRHYLMTEAEEGCKERHHYPVGDNYGTEYAFRQGQYVYERHDGIPDHMLEIIRISRPEGREDLLLLNFQAHATLTGGCDILRMSSDYPGVLRERVEAMLPGTRAVFFQGAAGNMNPKTRIEAEGLPGLTYAKNGEFDHRAYAGILASCVREAVRKGLQESLTDDLAIVRRTVSGALDHSSDHLAEAARKVADLYEKEGRSERVHALTEAYGFTSPYQCSAILEKARKGKTGHYELNAVRLGDAAFVTAPFELFAETGLSIKAASPFRVTFISGYTGDMQQYLPSEGASSLCYERALSRYEPGTAETLRDIAIEMLKELENESRRKPL